MSDSISQVNEVMVKIYYGFGNPRSFGTPGPEKARLNIETGRIELLDYCGDPVELYKSFAGQPITLRGIFNKNLKWVGYLGCKETQGNFLYIKDLLQVPLEEVITT